MTSRSYPARVDRVVDGDTFRATVDVGFGVTVTVDVRVAGVNAATKTTPAGKAATEWFQTWVGTPSGLWPFTLTTLSARDKYGRRLGDLTKPGGSTYSADALTAGVLVTWDGRGPKPV